MSCGPKAVMSRSPDASAVRASAKRWNITVSSCTLYFAAYSGSRYSGESAGTLSMPSLAFTGCASGVRMSSWASAVTTSADETISATAGRISRLMTDASERNGVGFRCGAECTVFPHPPGPSLKRGAASGIGRGAKPPSELLTDGVPQFASEQLDGAAGAAGELQLPLALGLEAAVAQPLCPRLDRLANGVSVEGVALELARAGHDVGCHADEGAERGTGFDRVLAAGPRRRERRRDGLDVVQEKALGALAQLVAARAAAHLLHRLQEVHHLLGERGLAHTTPAGAEHLDLAVERRRVVLVERADDVVGQRLVRIRVELAAAEADDVRGIQPRVLGVDRHEQLDDLPRVERIEEHRGDLDPHLLAGLGERVERQQPMLAVEHAEHAVLFRDLQQADVVVAGHRREREPPLGGDDDRPGNGRERARVLALPIIRHELVDLPADDRPLVSRLALADSLLESIPVDARTGLVPPLRGLLTGTTRVAEDLEFHQPVDVLGRESCLVELHTELLHAARRHGNHG